MRSLGSIKLYPGVMIFSKRNHYAINPKNIKDRTNYDLVTPELKSLFRTGSVLISTLETVFDNLALEEWIYRNYDFSIRNESILLMWTNRPAVVIGRHQNVWLETSVQYCLQNGIDIARRNSGGGTVYHDPNNLNLSFITSRNQYDRTKNLTFIRDLLRQCFNIQAEITPRKDLVVSGRKISGTASKLNAHNSYHHFTLMVDVDRQRLHDSLRIKPLPEVSSNATRSVPASTLNLLSLNSSLSIQRLIETISDHYRKETPNATINRISETGIFGGIDEIRQMYRSWSWIYGSTPRFTIEVTNNLSLVIERGCIKEMIWKSDDPKPQSFDQLLGVRMNESDLRQALTRLDSENSQFGEAILKSYHRLT